MRSPFQRADGQRERNVLGNGRKRGLNHLHFVFRFAFWGIFFCFKKGGKIKGVNMMTLYACHESVKSH